MYPSGRDHCRLYGSPPCRRGLLADRGRYSEPWMSAMGSQRLGIGTWASETGTSLQTLLDAFVRSRAE